MTTIVRTAIAALAAALGPDFVVDFVNTGGGCMAVEIRCAGAYDESAPYILVTDGEDVYGRGDLDSDDDVCGFFAALHVVPAEIYADGDDSPRVLFAESLAYPATAEDDEMRAAMVADIRNLIPAMVATILEASSAL